MNDSAQPDSLVSIAREFLRLGFVAFGGPPAHVAMMQERFVDRKQWLTRSQFLDLFGVASLLPGPSSTELAIYLGHWRRGFLGMLIAGASFILPSAFLVGIIAWAYVRYGTLPQIEGVLFGIKPVVVALVVQAVANLSRTALKSWGLATVALVVVALSALHWPLVILLISAGLAWMLIHSRPDSVRPSGLSWLGTGAPLSFGLTSVSQSAIFLYFFKIGAIVFGSGFVLLAVLQADLVTRLHWVNESQLLDAIAISQATPGPFFTVATFLGYLLGGAKGAALATIGMFLPAFLYVRITANSVDHLRRSPAAARFLDGVNAAALALMAFVAFQFARGVMLHWSAVLIFIVAFALLWSFKVSSAWVVLGGALAGLLLHGR